MTMAMSKEKRNLPLRSLGLFLPAALAMLTMITVSTPVRAEEESLDKTWIMINKTGKAIFETAHALTIGDEYIAEDNTHYRVVGISGNKAQVETLGKVALMDGNTLEAAMNRTSTRGGVIGIYQTHTDESYVPTSGRSSKIKGGDILRVGAALEAALKRQGYRVIHSDANFAPHDGGAYHRSRREAVRLLKDRPIAIIDVHRDAGIPAHLYSTDINGKAATKVTLVVGRQNQNRISNFDFAKAIKNAADTRHPGLIKGILWAHGNYNQDLGPRAILMEFGSDKNSLREAERSASAIASALPAVVNPSGKPMAARPGESATGGSGRTVLWLVVGILVIGGLYLLVNKKGLKGLRSEFGDIIGKDDDKDDPDSREGE